MKTLAEKFTIIAEQLAAAAAEAYTARNVSNIKLQAILDTLDLIIVNNAANAKAILAAIGQNSPCMPCPTPPIVIPPIGTTPLPVNTEACQRAQAFLNFMVEVFTVLDVASAVGIGFNPALITDAFNQVIATLTGVDEPDPISFPEAVQLVGDLVSYIASNLLVGNTLVGLFMPLYSDLRDALASAGSADEAKVQYDAIIGLAELGAFEAPVLIDAAYSAAYTYFFDPASEPDLSGISGDVCAGISGCETQASATTSINGGGDLDIVAWTAPFNAVNNQGGNTSTQLTWCTDDLAGWTATATRQVRIFDGNTNMGEPTAGTPFTFPATTSFVAFVGLGAGGAFTVELCPPE